MHALSGNPREILRVCLQAGYDLSGEDSQLHLSPNSTLWLYESVFSGGGCVAAQP
jgi:hypothetical protein